MTWKGTRPQKIVRLVRTFAADPVVVSRALPGEIRQWYQWHGHGEYPESAADEAWDEHLHRLLGAAWPCPEVQRLDELMADVGALLTARGGFGRETYGWYTDAENRCAARCGAWRCNPARGRDRDRRRARRNEPDGARSARAERPRPPMEHRPAVSVRHRLHAETGAAVTDACRPRWSYLEGSSKQRLPPLVAEVGHVESSSTTACTPPRTRCSRWSRRLRLCRQAGSCWSTTSTRTRAFTTFANRHPDYQTVVCPSADRTGMFASR